ncbi:MAG: acyl-ACP--UDP-N-acetylglucosamine O-acyltransferase [Mariniblastus sp.]
MDILNIQESSQPESNEPPKISNLASVHPDAQIANGVEIGPFCVIGPEAKIGARSKLLNSVTILGDVTIGEDNIISPGAVLGGAPQDLSYRGTVTKVVIGDRNVIRECVTVNRATEKEDGYTRVGNDCYFMGNVHIAHDCRIGNRVIIGHGSMLGGHVHVDSHATLSGSVAVTHYGAIGCYTFVGAASRVLQDIAPYMLADGSPARARCINIVALKRNDFSADVIDAINEAYRLMYRARVGLGNCEEILESKGMLIPEIRHFLDRISVSQAGRHGRGRDVRRKAA